MTVLVTGASGFVGQALCAALEAAGQPWRGSVRTPAQARHPSHVVVGELGPGTDWTAALRGVDCVVHLAARVHQMQEQGGDPLAAFRAANTEGTRTLARAAREAGVRRLVLVSSVKACADASTRPLTEDDPPQPPDAYGQSKREAELALWAECAAGGLQGVCVRPPLVYGPGVRANFLALLGAVHRGIPLPLGCIDNRRSLVGVHNLVSALLACARHPAAAGETFFVSDGEDLSTPALIRRLARALGVRPRLLPVPVALLQLAGRLSGRSEAIARLTGSLQLDSSRLRSRLAWEPPQTVDAGLAAVGQWFRSTRT